MQQTQLVVVGPKGSGKSTLIKQFTTGTVDETCTPTCVSEFYTTTVKNVSDNCEKMNLDIIEVSGDIKSSAVVGAYLIGASNIVLVYDASDEKSLDNLDYWLDMVKKYAPLVHQVFLLGNKSDLKHAFDPVVIQTFTASHKNIVYFNNIDAKNYTAVKGVFMDILNRAVLERPLSTEFNKNKFEIDIKRLDQHITHLENRQIATNILLESVLKKLFL